VIEEVEHVENSDKEIQDRLPYDYISVNKTSFFNDSSIEDENESHPKDIKNISDFSCSGFPFGESSNYTIK
jgi:hypothetical protein